MDVFTMVVIVVIVGCATGVLSDYFKNKHKYGNSDALIDAEDRIDELEERIRVLEKVITDDKYDLSRQIDSLND